MSPVCDLHSWPLVPSASQECWKEHPFLGQGSGQFFSLEQAFCNSILKMENASTLDAFHKDSSSLLPAMAKRSSSGVFTLKTLWSSLEVKPMGVGGPRWPQEFLILTLGHNHPPAISQNYHLNVITDS